MFVCVFFVVLCCVCVCVFVFVCMHACAGVQAYVFSVSEVSESVHKRTILTGKTRHTSFSKLHQLPVFIQLDNVVIVLKP